MNTTWPRYREEEEGAPVVACNYYQHSCDQHIEEEGRSVLAAYQPDNLALYQGDTFPRDHSGPSLPAKSRSRHHREERGGREHRREREDRREDGRKDREDKEERRERKDREHREREQREREKEKIMQKETRMDAQMECVDCQVSAPSAQSNTLDRSHAPDSRSHAPDSRSHAPDSRSHAPDSRSHAPDSRSHIPDPPFPEPPRSMPEATRSHNTVSGVQDYSSQNNTQSRDVEANWGRGDGRARDGVESGYSTQSREKGKEETVPFVDSLENQVNVQPLDPPSLDPQYGTVHKSPSRRKSRGPMARSVPGTLDRRDNRDMSLDSCDMDTMPLTPASFGGLDHKDLEDRPLTSMTSRMCKPTMYDEPPEKSSLFITCSALYAFLLLIICLAFLTSEVVTDNSPLHYYEGFFSFLFLMSIFFLFYVFCYLLHEPTCCRPDTPQQPLAYYQTDTLGKNSTIGGMSGIGGLGGMDYCGLQDGYPQCKMKKHKTSENDQSHGSFFLRVGGLAFGLGTMVYVGLEFGSWFEIPWTSPCYQSVRGVNPVLQVIFTFSQMYFVFMQARLNIHQFKCLARFGLMHIVATNICVWIRTIFKEGIKDIATYRVSRGEGVSEDFMIKEGYQILRQRFGNDSFWIHGPYHYIMKAIFHGEGIYRAFSLYPQTQGPPGRDMLSTTRAPPPFNPGYNPAYPPGSGGGGFDSSYPGQRPPTGYSNLPHYNLTRSPTHNELGLVRDLHGNLVEKFDNFTCGRQDLMGDIVTKASPYLYPFVIEFSLIGAAVLLVMWARVGKNPRYWGDDDLDRVSVTSRKMITYTRVDCVGASKGLFFGLLVLVASLICLILFFVLIDHGTVAVSQLAVFLADISHAAIMILSLLAILLGFCRITQLKFHGEPTNVLTDSLLKIGSLGVFAYSSFSIIAGCLGDYRRLPNLVVMVTGIISIVQVVIQLLFIQDVSRRRIYTADQDRSKPGRQVVTFLLICNLAIWVIYTFEVQKVKESPVQIEFFGYQPWVIIQKLSLPLCIFFRFLSTVALAEIWKNSYKTKLID